MCEKGDKVFLASALSAPSAQAFPHSSLMDMSNSTWWESVESIKSYLAYYLCYPDLSFYLLNL